MFSPVLLNFPARLTLLPVLLLSAAPLVLAQETTPPAAVSPPILARYDMEPSAGKADQLFDFGPLGLHGKIEKNAAFVPGGIRGAALKLSGEGEKSSARVNSGTLLDKIGSPLTVAMWVKPEKVPPQGKDAVLLTKRESANLSAPFELNINHDGNLGLSVNNGKSWMAIWTGRAVEVGKWTHIAFSHPPDGKCALYVDGKLAKRVAVSGSLAAAGNPMLFGWMEGGNFQNGGRSAFAGLVDEVRFYASVLTPEQILADKNDTLKPLRAAKTSDFAPPSHAVNLRLTRYDQPNAASDGFAPTRKTATRQSGPDAVDWPQFSLRGKPLWAQNAAETRFLPLRDGDEAKPLFQSAKDEKIEPGNHWFRPLQWMWGRRVIYTTDRTARSKDNDYELWAFPIFIQGAGENDVRDVVLKSGGQAIYENKGPLRSLTLLLPQNEPENLYELSVAGRAPVKFSAGLLPFAPGNPREIPIAFNISIPGAGPRISVSNLSRPGTFLHQKEWDADTLALAAAPPAPLLTPRAASFARYLGLEVPRSPLSIYAAALPHGMSSSFLFYAPHAPDKLDAGGKFSATPTEYAKYLAQTGYDTIFEQAPVGALSPSEELKTRDILAQSLASEGVKFGLVPDPVWRRPFLGHPNLAFFAHNLPDYRAPLFRDLQISAQHLARYGNFAGVSIGADNAGYVTFWDWAPPLYDRPWGEAFTTWTGGKTTVPEAKSLGGKASTKEFAAYLARYDQTFAQYGYFGRALREVNPKLVATTGSFGSSPGGGGRGGWPWASLPGREMFSGLDVQQAYDWDETTAAKPLHNLALVDRLKSYAPEKQTWALVDDFFLKHGREARGRIYALTLTRGIQGLGTNWLALPSGKNARSKIIADQKEVYDWAKKYGGAYAKTASDASIGILYVHPQALMRRVVQAEKPTDEELLRASHEGKTTEALFACHMAGWPAKIITPEELRRGLPASMKAVMLTGLNRFDESWNWYDGLEAPLKSFVTCGGRLIVDDESVAPPGVATTKTDLQIRAFVTQGAGGPKGQSKDKSPQLLERNLENVAKLQSAMAGLQKPLVFSQNPTIWAVPHTTGDVQYVTVVNWGNEVGQHALQVVKPQIGALEWNSNRPIYDLRSARKLAPDAAKNVDLTREAFQVFALTPREIGAPKISTSTDKNGFLNATVDLGMRGVPVQIEVSKGAESATIYGASGEAMVLPIRGEAGNYSLTATELLSKLSAKTEVTVAPAPLVAPQIANANELQIFAARKEIPLSIALTPAQAADPQATVLAKKLADFYTRAGRKVEMGSVAPNGVVMNLQPLQSMQKYPRWKTADTDLVLLGTPQTNVLLLDQRRGMLLPDVTENRAVVTHSPFVGERNALNLLAPDAAGLTALVARVTQ